MNDLNKIKNILKASILVKQQLLQQEEISITIQQAVLDIVHCFQTDGKVLFCGNGGSAADAQHLAAEFSGRFYYNRAPLFAEALHVNGSYLTAVANDYSFNEIYARIVQAKGRKGDVLVAISTSGNSPNVIKALEQAKKQGMTTIGLTGQDGGLMTNNCDLLFRVPSSDTPRIQECHILIGHTICELVEDLIFKPK
ncbi:D-sedoheptulose-7-phosphate isomerase [Aureispira anguillae]|uniref:Phosphoheptose isomerase n=1 Tax=Aureispira anguillae TaxID=2864201 RepID=A0A915YLD6_9BACT|nr:D-sedoheptulose 7-phosphate isomerase [Aureispira anguillae]BDS14898.1 D-sedoheptulose 7-phosphate isomerase [Aureispira anguillae]